MSTNRAESFSRIALNYLRHHHLPPTPVNYAVVYAWTEGADQDLNRFIESRAGRNAHAASEPLLQEAHGIFIGEGRSLERLEQRIAQAADMLTALRAAMAAAAMRQAPMATAISSGLRHLLHSEEVAGEVKEIMRFAETTIRSMSEAHAAAVAQLDDARKELATVRTAIAEHTKSARICPLTGLANRRALQEAMRRVVDADRERVASMIVLDVDHLRKTNDLHGHRAGDAVLRQLGEIIRATAECPEVVLASRFGGEEFALLCTIAHQPAVVIAEALRQRIAASPVEIARVNGDPYQLPFTASFGVAGRQAAEDADSLLERADDNLFAAKRQGRNRVVHD